MFVNPFGGRKQGMKIFKEQVKPLLDIAGVAVSLTITQRQNHARDLLLEDDLSMYDGVVCVGGDGTFAEVNGCKLKLPLTILLCCVFTYYICR